MKRPLFFTLASVTLVAAPLVAGVALQSCSGGGSGDAGDANPYGNPTGPCMDGTIQMLSCTAVIEGGAQLETFSDEACLGLDTAEQRRGVMQDDAQAPAIDSPVEGAALPSATPFTFAWHPQGLSYRRVSPRTRALAWRDELARWTTLLPAAEAHCAEFGGTGYGVVFTADGQQILRANTAHLDYVPTADAWAHLVAARGTITMTVEVARFADNTVTAGPVVQMTPRHFTITH